QPVPISMCEKSPRRTAPNQTLVAAPIRTSPMSTAVGAIHTSSATVGRTPSSSTIVAISGHPLRERRDPGDHRLGLLEVRAVAAGHHEALHRPTRPRL